MSAAIDLTLGNGTDLNTEKAQRDTPTAYLMLYEFRQNSFLYNYRA